MSTLLQRSMMTLPRTRARTLHLLVLAGAVALLLGAEAEADREEDPDYWVERLEAALLPEAAMRADVSLRSTEATGPAREWKLHLIRVEGDTSLRTRLDIESSDGSRRIERLVWRDPASFEHDRFLEGQAEPTRLPARRTDFVLGTALRWEDLGFTHLHDRAQGQVEFADRDGRQTVRLSNEHGPDGGRVTTILDRHTALPIVVEYFDRAGELTTKVSYEDIKKHGPFSYPFRVTARRLADGTTTQFELQELTIGGLNYESELGDEAILLALRLPATALP